LLASGWQESVHVSVRYGAGDTGVPFRDIAEVIGRPLNLPVTALSPDEAHSHYGLFAPAGVPASSTLTRKQLGWDPVHPGLIEDLDKGMRRTERSACSAQLIKRDCRPPRVGARRLFAKKACGLGSPSVTAALLACAELAG
jgi:hypothetical protein